MRRLHDQSKQIGRSQAESAHNTRRAALNMPLVERKLDVVSGDYTFTMDFPLTKRDHSAILTLKIKPDNCCECDPGAQTVVRDAVAYWGHSYGIPNGVEQPFILVDPLEQTGTNFNYGWTLSGFGWDDYIAFPYIAGYSFNPTGGLVIPVDGVYSALWKMQIGGRNIGGSSQVIMELRTQIPQPDGTIKEERLSRKILSVAKGNLTAENSTQYLYATCVPLFGGSTLVQYITVIDIPDFSTSFGHNTDNSLRVNLLGLGYGSMVGKVFNQATGDPIVGATVSYVEGFGNSTVTDEFGYYAFYNIRPATYQVTVTAANYYSMTRTVTVYFNKITDMDFNLTHI